MIDGAGAKRVPASTSAAAVTRHRPAGPARVRAVPRVVSAPVGRETTSGTATEAGSPLTVTSMVAGTGV